MAREKPDPQRVEFGTKQCLSGLATHRQQYMKEPESAQELTCKSSVIILHHPRPRARIHGVPENRETRSESR